MNDFRRLNMSTSAAICLVRPVFSFVAEKRLYGDVTLSLSVTVVQKSTLSEIFILDSYTQFTLC